MTGFSINTVSKLLVDLGTVCADAHNALVRSVNAKQIHLDEIWAFVGSKQKNAPEGKEGEYGDIWMWTAIDADPKLIISYLVGQRTTPNAFQLLCDVAARVTNECPQVSSDGLAWYAAAMEEAMPRADFGMIVKKYSAERLAATRPRVSWPPSRRYEKATRILGTSPRRSSSARTSRAHVDASVHAPDERLQQEGAEPRARGRATLCRIYQTLRVTPAMEAGLAQHPWTIEELVGLLEAAEKKAA
jgi:IS1 family transposase